MKNSARARTGFALIPIPIGGVLGILAFPGDFTLVGLIVACSVFASAFILHRREAKVASDTIAAKSMAISFVAVGAFVGWVVLRESLSLAALAWAMMGYASWFMWLYVSTPNRTVAGIGVIIPGTFMVGAFGFFLVERIPSAPWAALIAMIAAEVLIIWEGVRFALRGRSKRASQESP